MAARNIRHDCRVVGVSMKAQNVAQTAAEMAADWITPRSFISSRPHAGDHAKAPRQEPDDDVDLGAFLRELGD